MNLRDRSEQLFRSWGHFTYRHRWVLIVVMSLVGVAFASQITRLVLDNSIQALLHVNDPTRIAYREFREQFGQDERVIIAIQPPEVFDLAFLERLRAFHRELEREVPYVEDITSLVNARATRSEGDELIVERLMEDWPANETDVAGLRARVLSNPLYVNLLVSESTRLTTVLVEFQVYSPDKPDTPDSQSGFDLGGFDALEAAESEFLSHVEVREGLDAILEVVDRFQSDEFRIVIGGATYLTSRLDYAMTRDMLVSTSLAIIVVCTLLFILFRRISAVLLPLFVVSMSVAATVGVMGIARVPISTITQILPAFLLVVGICDSIHVLVIFYQRIAAGDGREDAIVFTLGHSGLAILMTSLTTGGGLLSFAVAELAPIAYIGYFAPLGVMLAFAYTVALLPPLLAVVPLRNLGARNARPTPALLGRFLRGCAHVSTRHPWPVVLVTAAIFVIALTGVTRLRFSHNAMLWFPETEPVRIATGLIDRELGGTLPVELVLRSERENEMQRPERLNQLDAIKQLAESFGDEELHVAKAVTLSDIVKEIHHALNENDPNSYAIPQDRQLVSQELLLFENSGSDDLEDIVDSLFKVTRVSMRVPQRDATLFPDFLTRLDDEVRAIAGPDISLVETGQMSMLGRTFTAVIASMGRSYVLALAIITPLMILLLGDLRKGLFSMPPNLAPVVFVLGLMGWMRIPLDVATLLIGGVIIGLAVDDTIHFMHNFMRNYSRTGDAPESVLRTLETTGMAMLVTTLVLSLGFLVFTSGYLVNVSYFGLLCTVAALIAFAADVLFAPALMVLVARRDERLRALADSR